MSQINSQQCFLNFPEGRAAFQDILSPWAGDKKVVVGGSIVHLQVCI